MGNNSSNPQNPLSTSVRSNNSYFGSSPEVGNASEQDLASTIREMNLERLYSRAPELRPAQAQEPQPPQQLKAVISFTNPIIKIIDKNIQIYDLCFEIQSEAPGRLVLTSSGEINSLDFEITKKENTSNQKVQLSLPLPTLSNFNVEFHPDLEHAKTQLDDGFQFVPKHEFIFEISQSSSEFQIVLKEQRLYTADEKILSIPINSVIPIENCFDYTNIYQSSTPQNSNNENSLIEFDNSNNDTVKPNSNDQESSNTETKNNIPCLICLQKEADTAIAVCAHKVICDDCLCKRAVRLHHCPICNKPTSF